MAAPDTPLPNATPPAIGKAPSPIVSAEHTIASPSSSWTGARVGPPNELTGPRGGLTPADAPGAGLVIPPTQAPGTNAIRWGAMRRKRSFVCFCLSSTARSSRVFLVRPPVAARHTYKYASCSPRRPPPRPPQLCSAPISTAISRPSVWSSTLPATALGGPLRPTPASPGEFIASV